MYKCVHRIYRQRERDHCSIFQATWPKVFESPLALLPDRPPFTDLKGRQNSILRARPRLFATVVIANKKWRWFSKQWFGQMIIHPSLLPSKLWGSCCSHIFCIGQETSQTEPLPKVMDFNKSKTSGGQSNWCSNVCRTLMKKARPWHLFRHFSTKRYFSQRHLLSLLLDRISGFTRGWHLDQCLSSGRVFLRSLPAAFHVSRNAGSSPRSEK